MGLRGLMVVVAVAACGARGEARPAAAPLPRFAPVPSSPNAVSSLAPATDAVHHVAPFAVAGEPAAFFAAAVDAALGMERTALVTRDAGYAHITFTTPTFRFVDDLELRLDAAAGVVHVRSASRVGYGDMGLNRRRVEELRARLPSGPAAPAAGP